MSFDSWLERPHQSSCAFGDWVDSNYYSLLEDFSALDKNQDIWEAFGKHLGYEPIADCEANSKKLDRLFGDFIEDNKDYKNRFNDYCESAYDEQT